MRIARLGLMFVLVQTLAFSFGHIEKDLKDFSVDETTTTTSGPGNVSLRSQLGSYKGKEGHIENAMTLDTVSIEENDLGSQENGYEHTYDAEGAVHYNVLPEVMEAKKIFKIRCKYPKEISDITKLEKSECLSSHVKFDDKHTLG